MQGQAKLFTCMASSSARVEAFISPKRNGCNGTLLLLAQTITVIIVVENGLTTAIDLFWLMTFSACIKYDNDNLPDF